jgi:hypothetical protein
LVADPLALFLFSTVLPLFYHMRWTHVGITLLLQSLLNTLLSFSKLGGAFGHPSIPDSIWFAAVQACGALAVSILAFVLEKNERRIFVRQLVKQELLQDRHNALIRCV